MKSTPGPVKSLMSAVFFFSPLPEMCAILARKERNLWESRGSGHQCK